MSLHRPGGPSGNSPARQGWVLDRQTIDCLESSEGPTQMNRWAAIQQRLKARRVAVGREANHGLPRLELGLLKVLDLSLRHLTAEPRLSRRV